MIKSTVPVLETHGTAITKRFYEQLFANHPELLNIFNHANQKQGRQADCAGECGLCRRSPYRQSSGHSAGGEANRTQAP
ncbi:globin domain-containing protein [Paenibacillus sp. P26]|nr:globin domain-containing protein [Paenibacillus sp. P26]